MTTLQVGGLVNFFGNGITLPFLTIYLHNVRGFGIARDYRGMTDVARRSAFLIDTNGTVRGAWAYEDGDVPDMDELIAAARGLRDTA